MPPRRFHAWKKSRLFPLQRQAAYALDRLIAVVRQRIERLTRPR